MQFYCTTDQYWALTISRPIAVHMFAEDCFISPDRNSAGESFWYVRRKTDQDRALAEYPKFRRDHDWMVFSLKHEEMPF